MSLAQKRYLAIRSAGGTYATTSDVDYGYVDAPLLDNGRYRAQRLAGGLLGVSPCHHSEPRKRAGIRLDGSTVGVARCAATFPVEFYVGPVGAMNNWARYLADHWFYTGSNILTLDSGVGDNWPSTLTFTPLTGGEPLGSWQQYWPVADAAVQWSFTLTGMNHSRSNGTHILKPWAADVGSFFTFSTNSIDSWNDLERMYVGAFGRSCKFPSAALLETTFTPWDWFLTIKNRFGYTGKYRFPQPVYPPLTSLPATIYIEGGSGFNVENWPLTLIIDGDYSTSLNFTLANMIDETINGTHTMDLIADPSPLHAYATPGAFVFASLRVGDFY